MVRPRPDPRHPGGKAKRSPMAAAVSLGSGAFFADGPPPPNLEQPLSTNIGNSNSSSSSNSNSKKNNNSNKKRRRPPSPSHGGDDALPSVCGSEPGSAVISSNRSKQRTRQCLLCAASATIALSVVCALYRLAVILPADYGAIFASEEGDGVAAFGRATNKSQLAAAPTSGGGYFRRRPEDGETATTIGAYSIQNAVGSAWSSLLSLGGSSSNNSVIDARLRQIGKERNSLDKLCAERAEQRRRRTRPRGRVPDGDTEEAVQEEEAKLRAARWPNSHAASSSSRTGLLPKRDAAVRLRHNLLQKKQKQEEQEEHDAARASNRTQPSPAPQLCGLHARSASTKHPTSYTLAPLTSRSRVLITGLLSTSAGYHLALRLATECRVATIVGIDAMYPNAIQHRLELSRRMNRLQNVLRKVGTELVRPVLLSYVGVDQMMSGGSRGSWPILNVTGELDYVRKYKPTHIVHLAGMEVDAYRDVLGSAGGYSYGGARRSGSGGGGVDGLRGTLNADSPYVSEDGTGRIPPMLTLRQRAAGMEQLLESLAGGLRRDGEEAGPHLTYASVAPPSAGRVRAAARGFSAEADAFHRTAAGVEEALATRYSHSDGVYSVGMRFSTVYGPMAGRPGVPQYDVVESAVRSWGEVAAATSLSDIGRMLLNRTGHLGDDDDDDDDAGETGAMKGQYLHVDDAVDAIVAAMQYRRRTGEAVVFDVGGSEDSTVTLEGFAEAVASSIARTPSVVKEKDRILSRENGRRIAEYLAWAPSLPFSQGISTLVSWHLEQKQPFGPPNDVDKDGSIAWRKAFHKTFDDAPLRRGRKLLPCASECARSMPCADSVFDGILQLTRDLTDGCDTVFYTSSWNASITEMPIETSYLRNATSIPEVCNLAFIPKDSPFVNSIVSTLRESILKSLGLGTKGPVEERIGALNGRLLHKGWILVFVESSSEEIDPAVKNMLKLAPRRMFASTVTKGIYVDGIFSKPAKPEDALFLSTMLRRDATKAKVYIRHGDDGRTYKISFPALPRRRAVMLAPIMRHPSLLVNATVDPSPNIGMKTAVKVMMLEVGVDPSDPASAPSHLRRQMDSYQYVSSFLNRKELRSSFEPNYLYESRHWISSKSLIHDFSREEGRQLRCEVYEEHSLWGNDYEQLSFSHVMAARTLRRQLHRDEPDTVDAKSRREKMTETDLVKDRVVNSIVDWHQWHSLVSEAEKAGRVSSPPSTEDIIEDLLRVKRILPERDVRKAESYVRIFLPHASLSEREDFDRTVGRLLPKTQRTRDFYRGKRKIYAV